MAVEDRVRLRLKSIFSGQKRRAKKHGATLDYTADDLIAHVLPLLPQGCPYCGVRLAPKGFQLDHVIPLARGGSHTLSNIAPCCTSCNRRKHALTDAEFRQLLSLLNLCSDYVKTNVLARLAAGGAWLAAKY